jgi:hypothetical protein
MPQPFRVREDETEQTQPNTGARNGFVGAFVRSVRRGQHTPAAGKVAIGALVVVLAAGSVVGLSVLLHGTTKPEPTAAAATSPSGGVGTGPRSAASSAAASKPGAGTKPTSGGTTVPGARGVPSASGEAGAPGVSGISGTSGTVVNDTMTNTPNNSDTGSSTSIPGSNRATAAAVAPQQAVAVANTPPKVLRGPTRIVGNASNRCVDVTGGTSGARLQIYDCSPVNTNSHQTWTFYTDETVRAKVTGQCMTVAGSWANGAAIAAEPCTGSPLQKFVLNGSRDLTNYSESSGSAKCVDVTGKATGDGAKLQLWTCEGTSNQKWS